MQGTGLFPTPHEIKLECSCPDWADMCKHVAAALYGVGARLDEKPQLLFVLRDVDETEMLASAGQDSPLTRAAPGAAKVLDESDVAALFGLEMAEAPDTPNPGFTIPKRPQQSKAKKSKISARKTKPAAKTDVALHRAPRASSGTNMTTRASARKRRTRRRPKYSVNKRPRLRADQRRDITLINTFVAARACSTTSAMSMRGSPALPNSPRRCSRVTSLVTRGNGSSSIEFNALAAIW